MEFMHILDQVKSLYAGMRQPRGAVGVCPITGATFVWGDDRVSVYVQRASRALLMRHAFAEKYPDLPRLPLSYQEREMLKGRFGLAYVLALYARSLATRDFNAAGHPSFHRYVRGCMAIERFREWASRDAPELLAAYPPETLSGLDASGCVNVPIRKRE
jgi:hypothetical protein